MNPPEDAGPLRARGPRMARDERRAQVLRIAQDLFSTEGYHHVSMDDIADRAEVSKPVLYRHFPSKLDLYLAVVDQRGAALLAAVEEAVAPIQSGRVQPGDGRRVLGAVVRAYMEFVEAAGSSASLLFESDVTRDQDVRARVEHASSEVARRIAGLLADVTGLGDDECATLAAALIAFSQGAATHRMRQPSTLGREDAAELMTQLLWAGVQSLVRADFRYGDA